MGLIWDLIQQGQIGDAQNRTHTLEQRVRDLEEEPPTGPSWVSCGRWRRASVRT